MNQLVKDLGLDLASKLSDLLAGQLVFVSNTGYISGISRYLNPNDAALLKEYYAGLKIYIPVRVENTDREIRNQKIMNRLRRGASVNTVAAEFGLSRRQIFNIKGQHNVESV